MNFEQSIARDNEEDHAYSEILIFARLLSKKKNYSRFIFRAKFPLPATKHAIRIFIPWIRLKVRNFKRVKINRAKTHCFSTSSVSNRVSRVLILDSSLDPRSYWVSRIENEDQGSRDCQLTLERYSTCNDVMNEANN